ncbi:MAG TPA: polyphosphate polymerase domain-containing protein [Ignavibacteriaceae bacterium]|nr:polyphosphate polymerase domain-containing protein [Ignavibacteriaceae bacterium]
MRLEYKYLVPVSELEKIRNKMAPYILYDKYALKNENKEYTVRSLYFDTPQLEYYFDKIEGTNIRKKIRIRVYDEYESSSIAFLEIKRKDGDYVSKFRAPLLYRDLNRLLKTREVKDLVICNGSDKGIVNAKMFLFWLIQDKLSPTSLVTYDREAFSGKFDDSLRITFDKNLRFLSSAIYENLFEEKKLKIVLKDKIILEVKFNHSVPAWLRDIITEFDLLRTSVSKYAICIDGNSNFEKIKKLALSKVCLTQLELSHSSERNMVLKQNAS